MENCPCGSNKTYAECCGIFISGQMLPPTPETLMRSRYTAYTKADIAYIQNTMMAPANLDFDPEEAEAWANYVKWLGLQVLAASQDGDKGSVEFMAHFSHDNNKQVLHEISEFLRVGQKWFYVNGVGPDQKPLSRASRKLSRNDTCPCGSQKKFKKCCGIT
jgi:SEC-C motif domain protein